ncbi:hypothetical protein FGG08_004751 [Glutinoglossum americanum]|uniref:EF-hand domain-containing protein n=1 Tax=Glutinoglossum americanum TaxID=1670608 RepID=A0A9P8HZW1_9PEZI|nr:hypothetical protein FGG08_004751 [Glutinoglossum americanum]
MNPLQSISSTYKPSPLSLGSPRASPFRRPESPASPSTVRATTPTQSPTKPSAGTPTLTDRAGNWTPRGLTLAGPREPASSPTRGANVLTTGSPMMGAQRPRPAPSVIEGNGPLAQLNPAQVRELREGFQLLDRDSDGHVGREDVADMLTNLGLDATYSTLSSFFAPSSPQTLTLPQFLTQLSALLSPIPPPQELLSAFAAFDDDDSGQVDLVELRDALLHTAPEPGEGGRILSEREVDTVMSGFAGRRAFGKGSSGRRGEVFRYEEFVGAVSGGGGMGGGDKEK